MVSPLLRIRLIVVVAGLSQQSEQSNHTILLNTESSVIFQNNNLWIVPQTLTITVVTEDSLVKLLNTSHMQVV